ncbi:transcriptional regulator, LacI family [Gemmiger formicilis]|uniref:Transcriptional regulator, LacI family n=1 Tax=Gemmiger formicilis TaxID=745368 RepID=A0A1T4Y749_9FIRM|nr:LacI family DNA-binding transcriptional regulator [Gemmiger formicilis]SKA97111.1 transcriptional regulator, LacI family [Gemmiger formicilis]
MNIYDIAKEAGVSIATVSRVLNNKGTVSAATRARVEAILKQNNYTPSAIARGMVSKSMRTVAVLTVDIRVPHYARTAYTIEREFSRRGYEVILCNTGGDRAETLRYLQAVNQKQVDGIVLVGSVFDTICQGAEMEKLLSGVPVVLANGKLDLPNAYSVTVDDKYGVSLAVEHLVARGRKNIYYIKDRDTDSAKSKRDGFLEAMRRNGLEFADHVLEAGETLASGIVCGEDLTAAGALKALLRAGLRVPEQVAVVGFNNSDYAHLCEPVLTSIDNKPEQVALLCVQLLESSIERSEAYSSVVLQPELAQGETS